MPIRGRILLAGDSGTENAQWCLSIQLLRRQRGTLQQPRFSKELEVGMVPITVLPGQGRLCVLNPWGGMYVSYLRGWHPGQEEAGMPQAGSVGWDMPIPVPIACAQLGREGERGAVPGAGHMFGFAGCHGRGGSAGQMLAAALALSPGWALGEMGPWGTLGLEQAG